MGEHFRFRRCRLQVPGLAEAEGDSALGGKALWEPIRGVILKRLLLPRTSEDRVEPVLLRA